MRSSSGLFLAILHDLCCSCEYIIKRLVLFKWLYWIVSGQNKKDLLDVLLMVVVVHRMVVVVHILVNQPNWPPDPDLTPIPIQDGPSSLRCRYFAGRTSVLVLNMERTRRWSRSRSSHLGPHTVRSISIHHRPSAWQLSQRHPRRSAEPSSKQPSEVWSKAPQVALFAPTFIIRERTARRAVGEIQPIIVPGWSRRSNPSGRGSARRGAKKLISRMRKRARNSRDCGFCKNQKWKQSEMLTAHVNK